MRSKKAPLGENVLFFPASSWREPLVFEAPEMDLKWTLATNDRNETCLKATRSLHKGSRILSEAPLYAAVRLHRLPDAHELTVIALERDDDEELKTYSNSAGMRHFDATRIPNAHDQERVRTIYSIMNSNQIYMETDTRSQTGFFRILSRINHACYDATAYLDIKQRPDGELYFNLRARRDMEQGEEITISYRTFAKGVSWLKRRDALLEQFGFLCQCRDCLSDRRHYEQAFPGTRVRMAVTSHANYTDGPVCRNCGVVEDLKQCSRCKSVWYCSKECQAHDWKYSFIHTPHKQECVPHT